MGVSGVEGTRAEELADESIAGTSPRPESSLNPSCTLRSHRTPSSGLASVLELDRNCRGYTRPVVSSPDGCPALGNRRRPLTAMKVAAEVLHSDALDDKVRSSRGIRCYVLMDALEGSAWGWSVCASQVLPPSAEFSGIIGLRTDKRLLKTMFVRTSSRRIGAHLRLPMHCPGSSGRTRVLRCSPRKGQYLLHGLWY